MKRILSLFLLLFIFISLSAQADHIFNGEFISKEHDVYFKINIDDQNIIVPGQDIFGEVTGFLKGNNDSRCWLVTSFEKKNNNRISLEIINDYGSEDLSATFSYNSKDDTYTLTQERGSTIKLAIKGKWVKLPKNMKFQRKSVK